MTITADYQCAACGCVWEAQRESASAAAPTCPQCHSTDTRRVYAAPAIVYSGDGWTGAARG